MGAGDSGLTEGVSELLLRSRSPAGGLGGLHAVTRKSPTVPHAGAGRHNPVWLGELLELRRNRHAPSSRLL